MPRFKNNWKTCKNPINCPSALIKIYLDLKTDSLPELIVDPPEKAKAEFDELSQLDEFEETEKEEVPIEGVAQKADGVLRPFGYEIFNLSPRTFESLEGGPVGPNYPLGPGDEIALTLWGDTEQFHTLRIDKEGKILIPDNRTGSNHRSDIGKS